MDRRERYLKAHVASLAEVLGERYGQAVQLDRDLRYVFLPRFTLPPRWGERETPLLLRIPDTYPDTPPNGFYLSSRCTGPHVFSRPPYSTVEDLSAKGWNWFCVHCHEGWKPGATESEEQNLWTFLNVIRASFTENEFY